MSKERVLMSHMGRRIRYMMVDSDVVFKVANGDGTDEYFSSWQDAVKWIEKHPRKPQQKRKMTVTYSADIGLVAVILDESGITCDGKFAYFTDEADRDYKVPVSEIVSIL